MNPILIKIFATALALSQVTARPDAVRTRFHPVQDQAEVVQILRAGCAQMRKAFGIEDVNLDELIATAMDDPQAMTGEIKQLRGINFGDLHTAYRQFCKNETVDNSPVDIRQVIDFYNKALAELPEHAQLKGLKLPGASIVLDANGERFAEVHEPEHRRIPVPLSTIPEHVQKAFIAAEDMRFFQHAGIDERGLIRAFIGNLTQPGRPQGGSTITQQVAKNLLVGDDVTYERKMREIIVAARLERTLTKAEILELYLNSIYLGRGSWGVEMAARSYFGKSAKALTLAEGALLAGLTKGPNYFGPDRNPGRARERLAYVLNRMQEDGSINAEQFKQTESEMPRLVAHERLRRDTGFHFIDQLGREAKASAGIEHLTSSSYFIHSTIHPQLQRATESALQEGLARYELNTRRVRFQGAEANLSEAIRRIEAEQNPSSEEPAWRRALKNTRLPLYDVHWVPATVTEMSPRTRKSGEVIRVGLSDGRVLPLVSPSAAISRTLKLHDVINVRVLEGRGKVGPRAELRTRPEVQGAALVLENKTGGILAMAGGFSYPLSQLNRTTQSQRQPGSAFKPLTYLAALKKGLQPNTLAYDVPLTLPPIGGASHARAEDYWTPQNYDRGSSGAVTLRRALENSKNLVTAGLLAGGIESEPAKSLQRICELALEAQLYKECVQRYPFVLGAQPVRLLELAAFYAAIANEGLRPVPHSIEKIEQNGNVVYRHDSTSSSWIGSADRVAFYQLKSMLQGVLERGTAQSLRQLAPYVAGKTGTTDNENDAWFVGFTNDVTVAVWVGYDNADGKRRTLGNGQTGAKVAIPIFEPIIQAAWAYHQPKAALQPPSPEAQRHLVALPINVRTGERVNERSNRAFLEYFRLDQGGRFADTQYRLVDRERAFALRDYGGPRSDEAAEVWPRDYNEEPFSRQAPWWRDAPTVDTPQWRGFFGVPSWSEDEDRSRRRSRRIDPDYFWSRRGFY
jgi:penicillin-binding protein 1A